MTEKEKMEAGLWYDANNDQELIDQRLVCQDLCFIKSFYSRLWKKYKIWKECFCEH